jgi:hypothetical protein
MEIINQLIDKITTWSQHDADKFHQYASRDTHFGAYMWETTANGSFFWRDIAATFFGNNGIVYKLTSQWMDNDWILHCKLFERISRFTDCNIEIPLSSKTIKINDITFLYTEVQRPTTEYDSEIWHDAMLSKINNTYMLEWIEHKTILLHHLNKVSPLLPRVFPKRISNGVEHAWIDFKKWEIPSNEYVNKNLGNLYRLMLRLESSYGILLDKHQLLKIAEKEWTN